jgi:hypothetical protein
MYKKVSNRQYSGRPLRKRDVEDVLLHRQSELEPKIKEYKITREKLTNDLFNAIVRDRITWEDPVTDRVITLVAKYDKRIEDLKSEISPVYLELNWDDDK